MKSFALVAPLLAGLAIAAPAAVRRDGLAPLHLLTDGAASTGGYIVVLNDDVEDVESEFSALGLDLPLGAETIFNGAFKGYSGTFDDATLALIRAKPNVAYVEPDYIMHASVTQSGAEYGLAISSQAGTLSTSQQNTYYYEDAAGSGTYVYVIDTGINTGHSQFGGRATMVANYISGSPNTDENGHGTHCAGTVGGSTYGIAKKVTLRGIKVLDSSGSGATSGILSGINYAVQTCPGKCVISMSLGGTFSSSLNQAVRNAVNAGVTTVVAAGNENQDACNTSPASESSAITVAALDSSYKRASFSNYGSCVDIFGPGVNIKSAWIGSTTATNTISGTSMATPHIAGLVAYFLSLGATSSNVLSYLKQYGQSGIVSGVNGSPNLLGNNGYFS